MRACSLGWVLLLLGCAPSPQPETPAPATVDASPQPPTVVVSSPPAPPAIAVDPATNPASVPSSPPVAEGDEPPLAPLAHRSSARSVILLRAELPALERLLAMTPRTSPDWPQIAERVGQGYGELALAETTDGHRDAAKDAHQKAVDNYASLAREAPSYRRLDEVLYAMGTEKLALGDRAGARKAWFELIKNNPRSKLVPHVYLGFADMFFDEAATEPHKLQLAKQAYREVLKYPPPSNQAWGYASYKLGWVHFNLGELPEALAAFQKAVEFGDGNPTIPGASAIAREARKDLVRAYARAGRPRTAWNYFQRVNGSRGDDARTVAMISRLGEAYLQDGQSLEALELYGDVASNHASPNACRALVVAIPGLQQAGAAASEVSQLEARVRDGCAGVR